MSALTLLHPAYSDKSFRICVGIRISHKAYLLFTFNKKFLNNSSLVTKPFNRLIDR